MKDQLFSEIADISLGDIAKDTEYLKFIASRRITKEDYELLGIAYANHLYSFFPSELDQKKEEDQIHIISTLMSASFVIIGLLNFQHKDTETKFLFVQMIMSERLDKDVYSFSPFESFMDGFMSGIQDKIPNLNI